MMPPLNNCDPADEYDEDQPYVTDYVATDEEIDGFVEGQIYKGERSPLGPIEDEDE